LSRLLVIDGNSILNRAFYGIMGSKMLMTKDGKYTNAVYGFLAIMFKVLDDLQPEYMAVAFDLKEPTARHKLYEGYKATRKGMPNELAQQMPIIKEILRAMNITIIEKPGYEADDILGTLSIMGEKDGLDVTILSGDRDTFQLATDKVTIRIPRTKMGKTEVDNFDKNKVLEIYGIAPRELIEVKGLMGDTSDNIPGVPGVGEKTALSLVKEYKTIENLYNKIEAGEDSVKGKLREKLVNNKDLAMLSKILGTINIEVPIEEKIEDLKVKDWNNEKVYEIFKDLNFKRYIERFSLEGEINKKQEKNIEELFTIKDLSMENKKEIDKLLKKIKENKKLIYFFEKEDETNQNKIIKKKIISISIYEPKEKISYYIKINDMNQFVSNFKDIFEDKDIEIYGYKLNEDFVMLKELEITLKDLKYDAEIAAYVLNPTNKYNLEEIIEEYLEININDFIENDQNKNEDCNQINLFDNLDNNKNELNKKRYSIYVYCIYKLQEIMSEKLKEINSLELFSNIEMPLVKVLGDMQFNGMYVDKEELIEFGDKLKQGLNELTNEIYELCGEEFNINSTQQLGVILFEKLELPVYKKTKKGYSTDVDILEKLKNKHPVIEKILEYRSLMKLNSTYVEGLLPYINEKTKRIHSYFHQTVTATGRISSTEPNLQNIPTRIEFGKRLRKVFKPKEGCIYIDADYSQIELRVLAHISEDKHMLEAFKNDEDIHVQAASKVLGIPKEEVTKEQRSSAKAVNFGIVYGISDFGLSEQLGISKKKAKEYIEQYLEKYSGIKKFMDDIVEIAKKQGYVETLFHRRRYIPEINSNNYMVRKFGERVAMNTPIQGTAADIMKIAMIDVYNKLKKENLDAKIILQVHDELMIECKKEDKEKVKTILKNCMENAITLLIPLKVETSEADNWYECK
jgi:DNA polymerase-1